MRVEFLVQAERELLDAVSYYNGESEGLGYEFAAEAERTLRRIVEYPEAWAALSLRTRRCRMNRFPFGLIYQIRDGFILIVAVMHLQRDPTSWRERLSVEDR